MHREQVGNSSYATSFNYGGRQLQVAIGGECRFRLLAGGFAVPNEVEHLAHTETSVHVV